MVGHAAEVLKVEMAVMSNDNVMVTSRESSLGSDDFFYQLFPRHSSSMKYEIVTQQS